MSDFARDLDDEITTTQAQERADFLRAVITDWTRDHRQYPVAPAIAEAALDALLAHVERLTNVLEYTQMRADAHQEHAEAGEREVERLTAELKRAAEFRPLYESAVDRAEAAERLAEQRGQALRQIQSGEWEQHEHNLWRFIDAALVDGGQQEQQP